MSTCPCAGAISEDDYRAIVDVAVAGLTRDPSLLLGPLSRRMRAMASAERFEEAAELRDRASALAGALARQRRLDGLRRAGRLVLDLPGGIAAELDGGRLVRTWTGGMMPLDLVEGPPAVPAHLPLPRSAADEVACVAAWLEKEAHRLHVVSCDGELASPVAVLPRFTPADSNAGAKVLVRPRS